MTRAYSNGLIRFVMFVSLWGWLIGGLAQADVVRHQHWQGQNRLVVEVLDDHMVRLAWRVVEEPAEVEPIYQSPMIVRQSYPGPDSFQGDENSFSTSHLQVGVNDSLCVQLREQRHGMATELCPRDLGEAWQKVIMHHADIQSAYGLGQYLREPLATNGNWIGHAWEPPFHGFGSRLKGIGGGATNDSMYPILYALGEGQRAFALFLDNTYKQMWDFRPQPFEIGMWGDEIRMTFFVAPQDDGLRGLRREYMNLTGKPPVPPRSMFGMWVSEFGFENWRQLDQELSAMRSAGLPVDGFGMDLQWFGGTFGDPDNTGMGSLRWNEDAFPEPAARVERYRDQEGVELMLIEEPYISNRLPEHQALQDGGFLVRDCAGCDPTFLSHNPWWGYGGMIDYTHPGAREFWHRYRRTLLTDMGIRCHWLDLGEPEQFNDWAWYHGVSGRSRHSHKDNHNIYNLMWVRGVAEGYAAESPDTRHFVLSRSGTSGIQRFGAAVWSGDIGTEWGSFRAQMRSHVNMSLSGVDYYGSDVGGFHRPQGSVEGGPEELYTHWFASSALIDLPLRPHSWNLDKQRPTSPARRGDLESNRHALYRRIALSPYYYTLAHRAATLGDPIVPPAFYLDQADAELRDAGHIKAIGPDLVGVTVTEPYRATVPVRLPAGQWVNFDDGLPLAGRQTVDYPKYRNGELRAPLFARAGAIIPMMQVDAATLNSQGRRRDSASTRMIVRAFAGEGEHEFTLIEDDGTTTAYRDGQVARTRLVQQQMGSTTTIVIHARQGSYRGAPSIRTVNIELVGPATYENLRLDGQSVDTCGAGVAEPCWQVRDAVTIVQGIRWSVGSTIELTAERSAAERSPQVFFDCGNVSPQRGQAVFVVGNQDRLGQWTALSRNRLKASGAAGWSGWLDGLSGGAAIEWKCALAATGGGEVLRWQPGENNRHQILRSPYGGATSGHF